MLSRVGTRLLLLGRRLIRRRVVMRVLGRSGGRIRILATRMRWVLCRRLLRLDWRGVSSVLLLGVLRRRSARCGGSSRRCYTSPAIGIGACR